MQHVDLRDEIQKQALVSQKLRAQHPEGFFDPQSIQDTHDFLDGRYSLADIAKNNLQFPELQERYDIQKNLFEKLLPAQSKVTSVRGSAPMFILFIKRT